MGQIGLFCITSPSHMSTNPKGCLFLLPYAAWLGLQNVVASSLILPLQREQAHTAGKLKMSQTPMGWNVLALTLGGLFLSCMHPQLEAHPTEAHLPRICVPLHMLSVARPWNCNVRLPIRLFVNLQGAAELSTDEESPKSSQSELMT